MLDEGNQANFSLEQYKNTAYFQSDILLDEGNQVKFTLKSNRSKTYLNQAFYYNEI